MTNVLLTGEAKREVEILKAEVEERQAVCKKKALQRANEKAGKETESEDEFEPRANPTASFYYYYYYSLFFN